MLRSCARSETSALQLINMNAFFLSVVVALIIAMVVAKDLETITSKVR